MTSEPELVTAESRSAWRRWLQRNKERPDGIWLEIHKKTSAGRSVSYGEAVEEALCFGWIDSTANTLDEEHYKLWFAPRKPTSSWSAINKERVTRMIDQGRMSDAGLAVMETARANGAWDSFNDSDALIVPRDLASALKAHGEARRHWDAFPPGVRKQVLEWIHSAKRDETRAKRITETATLAARNELAHQWRKK